MIVKYISTRLQYKRMQEAVRALPSDILEAKKRAYKYWLDKLIIEHFKVGADSRLNYTPNKPEYNAWKIKKFGVATPLMLHGVLMRSASKGIIIKLKTGIKILWSNAPVYGKYQIEAGRNWQKRDKEDLSRIRVVFKKELISLRRIRLASI